MSITFHCEHCGNKITAKDESAGKWGVCPACHNKLYIPNLNIEDTDDLKLEPIDQQEEQRRKQLLEETHKLTLDILSVRDEMKAAARTGPAAPSTPINEKQLEKKIIAYLRKMADGKLDQARMLEIEIVSCGKQAKNSLVQISESMEAIPELANIPGAVVLKIIKNLNEKIL
jgi:CRISPR/Cas system-associated protein Cas10 (large subunit of type III CRISPR-Cas system)